MALVRDFSSSVLFRGMIWDDSKSIGIIIE